MDLRRNYRVCAFHRKAHGGVHIHDPVDAEAGRQVDIRSPSEAEAVMTAYAETMAWFEIESFLEVMKRWRSDFESG